MVKQQESKKIEDINNITKGKAAEKKAREFLIVNNYEIVHANWRCNTGEIDIVAKEGKYLCFIEVKYRSSNSFGLPREAVDHKKKQKLINLAHLYLLTQEKEENIRFDVVEVHKDKINLIKNAFSVD